jgi:hypothetical protein
MGFNLGLAAAAYQGAKAEERRMRDDAFTQAQHDYAVANMDEQKSRRTYRDNAAALSDAKVQQESGLLGKQGQVANATLDGQIQNIPKQADVAGLQLDGQLTNVPLQTQATTGTLNSQIADQGLAESLRPKKAEAATLTADTAVKTAQTANDDATDVRTWSPIKRQQNADKIDFEIANRPEVQSQYQDKVLAGIYAADQTGKVDEHAIVDRLNAVADSKLFPELHGKQVQHVAVVGDQMVLRDATGNDITSFPVARMKAAHDRLNPGSVLTMGDGVNAYKKNPDGSLTKLTDNKKTVATGAGLGGAARSSKEERLAAQIQAEYAADPKNGGKKLSTADALAQIRSDPVKWAMQLDKADERLKYEKDPAKRAAIQNENRRSVGAPPIGGANTVANPVAPSGLDSVSPQSQAKINAVLGL